MVYQKCPIYKFENLPKKELGSYCTSEKLRNSLIHANKILKRRNMNPLVPSNCCFPLNCKHAIHQRACKNYQKTKKKKTKREG